jgi:hypothetical protein
VVLYWQLAFIAHPEVIIPSYASEIDVLVEPSIMEIWAAPFTCEVLWTHLVGEVGMVEGVDMSAINRLMQGTQVDSVRVDGILNVDAGHVPNEEKEAVNKIMGDTSDTGRGSKKKTTSIPLVSVTSVRLSQWGGKLGKPVCLGTMTMKQVICESERPTVYPCWSGKQRLDLGSTHDVGDDVDDDSRNCTSVGDDEKVDQVQEGFPFPPYHGVAFWTRVKLSSTTMTEIYNSSTCLPPRAGESLPLPKDEDVALSTNPIDYPESMQAVQCFQQPVQPSTQAHCKPIILYAQYHNGQFSAGIVSSGSEDL